MNSVGDEEAVRSGVYMIESREYVDSAPKLGTSLFDDLAKLRQELDDASRSLKADETAIENRLIADERGCEASG